MKIHLKQIERISKLIERINKIKNRNQMTIKWIMKDEKSEHKTREEKKSEKEKKSQNSNEI